MSKFFTGAVSGLLGLTAEAPIASAFAAAPLAKDIGGGIADFVRGLDLMGHEDAEAKRQQRNRQDFQRMMGARNRDAKRLRMQNLARLAAAMPDAYNQVFAGRRLPRGAVVIGGRPRTDLLAELADSMAQGGPEPA